MNINLTLFGEMITFAVLVWVMMKYIWPPLVKIIEERQEKIASGLEAAEQGRRELERVRLSVDEQLHQAKVQATTLLEQANQQASDFLMTCKTNAQIERDKILAQAKLDLEQEMNEAETSLQQRTVELVITATERILQQKVDEITHKKLIDNLISSI
ncbi:MAG: F0F1 ATP synthase subunit B [Coxiellaceae bacterium]|jgi:F-type H+-transporting ATPase subunit b|nr:F0F1 ATP synthase subunit B [Coxiellaceae bacterium]